MQMLAKVVGGFLMLTGIIWILQGINVLPGSFMTGQMQWAAFGAVALVVGAAFFQVGRNMKKQ